jgi:hypothetical protein
MISSFEIEDVVFEDAYIKNISMQGDDIKLDLVCFAEADDRFSPNKSCESVMASVSITFHGVHYVTIDGVESSNVAQLMKEGTIESFERNDNSARILVEWNDYDAELRQEAMYEFRFQHFEKKTGEKFLWRWKQKE